MKHDWSRTSLLTTLALIVPVHCGPQGRDPVQQTMYKVHVALAGIQGFVNAEGTRPFSLEAVCQREPHVCAFSTPSEWFKDGWGQPLLYSQSGLTYAVASLGPDGKEGTADDLALFSDSIAELVRQTMGCFTLSRRWWRLTPEDTVVLDTVAARPGEYAIEHPAFPGKAGVWYPIPNHHVYAEWGDVRGVASLWLVDSNGALTGKGEHATDISLRGKESDVMVTRVECPI